MGNIELIEEIREKIDKLDLKILDLIDSRKKLVDEVVKLKTKEQIVDQKRIEKILNKLDKQARKKESNQRSKTASGCWVRAAACGPLVDCRLNSLGCLLTLG